MTRIFYATTTTFIGKLKVPSFLETTLGITKNVKTLILFKRERQSWHLKSNLHQEYTHLLLYQ